MDQFFFEKPLQAVCDECVPCCGGSRVIVFVWRGLTATLPYFMFGCCRVLRDGSTMLQDLLRKHLLNNPHKLRVHLKPDAEFGDKREAAERERLRAIRDGMDGNDLARVRDEQEVRP